MRVAGWRSRGIIRGYRIAVNRKLLHFEISRVILSALPPEKYDVFYGPRRENPGIISHYHVIGVFNALLRCAARGDWRNSRLP